jgi:3'-phosphoadenosine 5'-phosphosulfate sulfotransferase (PAPS reductase)/FAD synthetase
MNIKKTYIALLSGGRDSTAMVELLLRENKQVDYILFDDTLLEFDEMYEYLNKFNAYIKKIYNKEITFLKPKSTFSQWVFGEVTRGERKGWIRGLPMLKDPCFWKRESKVKVTDLFIKENNILEPVFYVGYTYSEQKRSQVKATNQIFPLIDSRKCEADVDSILKEIDMVNPLYEFFERTGCAICPYQSDRSFYTLMIKFPEQWGLMKWYERELKGLKESGSKVVNSQWDDRRTLLDMEKLFLINNKHFSAQAPKSCECKSIILDTQQIIQFDSVV